MLPLLPGPSRGLRVSASGLQCPPAMFGSSTVPSTEDILRRPVPVRLLLHDGLVLEVHLFLAPFAATHAGEERLEDLLNGRDAFLRARDLTTGESLVLQRASIVLVRRMHESEELDVEWLEPYARPVELTLMDGTRLEGQLRYAHPTSDHPSDFLSSPPLFFPLEDAEGVALVNKVFVSRVVTREG